MHQLSRLLLSGLVALTLTVAAVPAQASWSASIADVMNLVYCLVGAGDCTGLQPGADLVDITSDIAEVAAAAAAAVDITTDNAAAIAAAVAEATSGMYTQAQLDDAVASVNGQGRTVLKYKFGSQEESDKWMNTNDPGRIASADCAGTGTASSTAIAGAACAAPSFSEQMALVAEQLALAMPKHKPPPPPGPPPRPVTTEVATFWCGGVLGHFLRHQPNRN